MREPPIRPTMVTVLAVVFIVGSIVMLLGSGFGAVVSLVQMRQFDPTLQDQPFRYPGVVFMTKYGWLLQIPDVILECLMLAAAIRLLALRRWAWKTLRIGTVVYLLMYTARSAWFFWAMTKAEVNPDFRQPPGFPMDVMKWVMVGGMAVMLVIAFVIALILYWLLSQATVVQAIRDAEEAEKPPTELIPPPDAASTS